MLPAVALAVALVVAPRCLAQGTSHVPDVLDSYRRAQSVLDSALTAHGGLEALRVVRGLHVSLEGRDIHRNQSRRVESYRVEVLGEAAAFARVEPASVSELPGRTGRTTAGLQ